MIARKMSFFEHAFQQALCAKNNDEVPVGAVIVHDGRVIAATSNQMRAQQNPTAHAELECIRMASHFLQTTHLTECDLYVTLEPCAMCAGAIAHARIRRLIFGAYDLKGGAVEHGARVFQHSLHKPEVVVGINESACGILLHDFFQGRR